MNRSLVGGALCVAFIAATTVHAQVTIPPGLEPGQVQQQLRQMRVPQSTSAVVAPRVPEQVAPAQSQDLRFVLRDVQIDGLKTYPQSDFKAAFNPLLGKEISVAQVFAVANQMTARFRGDGYILSQVLVPAQNIVEGHVRLVAVEGFIAAVQFRGDVGQSALLDSYAASLRNAHPLTAKVLERYLLLMNDLPHTAARGTLLPSATVEGAADLIIDVSRRPETVQLDIDNRNSRSLGPWRVNADIEVDDLLSTWDAVTLRAGWSPNSELAYGNLNYAAALGHRGAQWSLGVTGVRARPGAAANLAITDLKTESVAGNLQVSYPLLRSRSLNLQIRGALTSFDGQSEFSLATVSDDRLRSLRAGLALDVTDRWRGISTVDVEYSQGLNALGARQTGTLDSPLSRIHGRTDYSKVTLYAARLQSLGSRWSALFAVSAQQAFTTLLAPELFAFGGEIFGRGFDAAELVGDSGESAKVELRYRVRPVSLGSFSPYTFYDVGRVRRRDAINESTREHASSAGGGIRWTGGNGRWTGVLEVAKPLDHDVAAEGNRKLRGFAALQVSF